jgi:hypothetical protein
MYTLAGFDLTTHNSGGGDDTTRPQEAIAKKIVMHKYHFSRTYESWVKWPCFN